MHQCTGIVPTAHRLLIPFHSPVSRWVAAAPQLDGRRASCALSPLQWSGFLSLTGTVSLHKNRAQFLIFSLSVSRLNPTVSNGTGIVNFPVPTVPGLPTK